jgi:hypothetical protein
VLVSVRRILDSNHTCTTMHKARLPLRTTLARSRTQQLRVFVTVRGYAQDVVRDPMTGELTSLPDIDVRVSGDLSAS